MHRCQPTFELTGAVIPAQLGPWSKCSCGSDGLQARRRSWPWRLPVRSHAAVSWSSTRASCNECSYSIWVGGWI